MKVILLENVRKVGSIGDIIDVKGGFARNFLISKKKALFASTENIKEVNKIENEIGRKQLGKSKAAQSEYQKGISDVFANVSKALHKDAKIFIVANDKFNLYEKIIKDSGMKYLGFKERAVEARAQGDKAPYSEKIFECALEN